MDGDEMNPARKRDAGNEGGDLGGEASDFSERFLSQSAVTDIRGEDKARRPWYGLGDRLLHAGVTDCELCGGVVYKVIKIG